MHRVFLSLGSSRVRLAIGLLLAALLLAQIISTFNGSAEVIATTTTADSFSPDGTLLTEDQRILNLAKTDHIRLLQLCLKRYEDRYRDYTATLLRRERIHGKFGPEQVIDVRYKDDPFSVVLAWRVGATRGDKVLYVENDPDGENMMHIHPTGWPGRIFRSVDRSPDDLEVRQSSLRSIREFGFRRGLESLIEVYQLAKSRGHLDDPSACTYLGTGELDGRPTFAIQRVLPPGYDYPAKVTIIEIDQEYLVPVHVYGTNWQDQDLCDYRQINIKFNVGLSDSDFTKEANGL